MAVSECILFSAVPTPYAVPTRSRNKHFVLYLTENILYVEEIEYLLPSAMEHWF
jgi:hypothetical protein